jgi:GNAT superfamily N-acetyltransferase
VIRISEVDPQDEATLRTFWEVEQEAQRHDRAHALVRTWDRLRAMTASPNPYRARTLLVARDGDEVVGCADVGGPLQDNTHLGELEINVRPERRRRGAGRALWDAAAERFRADGRTSVTGEVFVPPGSDGADVAAYEFASALGFASVLTEDHLVLEVPVDAGHLAVLRSRGDAAAYDLLTWTGACPEEHLDAYAEMRTRMNSDVPVGEVDVEPVVVDPERIRVGEQRTLRSFDQITAVARREDGVFGGYSLVYLPHGEDHALQDDTLVMPEHRGHRLGTQLKLATLDVMTSEFPERRTIHTWTADDNRAMQATNADFGFVSVERMHEMQRRDG